MPLQTACSECSAKIKVKDELVGKSIKCPKCGKVFKALAGDAENAAVQAGAAASRNGAASKPAAKKPPPPAWGDDEDEGEGEKEEKASPWDKKSKKDEDEDEDDEDDAKAKKKPAKKGPPPKKRAAEDDEDEDEDDAKKGGDSAFEDLLEQTTLSPLAKKQISGEIGLREKGVWVGQPDPKILTVRGIPKAIMGCFAAMIVAIVASVLGGSQAKDYAVLIIGGIVVLWLFACLLIMALVLFMERKKALGTAYVITNKRCITMIPGWFTRAAPTSYYPDLVQHMRRMPSWIFGADSGDIVFRSVTVITTSHSRRHGTTRSVQTPYYGFLGIRQLDEVEGRIRQALLSGDDDDDDDDDEDDDDDRRKKKKKKKKKRRDDDDDDD